MTELEKKLEALDVLDKFKANLEKTSSAVREAHEGLLEEQTFEEFVKMLGEISPGYAMSGAFRWPDTPEGTIFWKIVSELVEYDIEMLSPELLHICCTRYEALN